MTPRAARGLSPVARYGLAVAGVAAATLVSLVVRPVTHAPASSLFVAAVMVSAWLGGLGAGAVATALAVVALDAVMSPTHLPVVFSEGILARLGVFMLVAVFVSVLDAARRGAELARTESLEREVSARADAEAANRAKDDFVTMVAHELRTPLAAIAGWVTAVRRGVLDAEQQARALEAIQRNVTIQARIVNDLVDLARIARGRLSLRIGRVDLRVVVEDAADAVTALAGANGIAVVARVAPGYPPVDGDAARLQQVFTNLLTNAIRHSGPGMTVHVDVDWTADQARIEVSDEGCGIPADLLPHVFERYRQADGEQARSGLGLGLAIVREIVERHGGRVEATSAGAGRGARFTVLLPTARDQRSDSPLSGIMTDGR